MKSAIQVTPLSQARRWVGLKELGGAMHNPMVVAMLQLVTPGVQDDETPWCSAFVNFITWELRLPRSNSLGARSWLKVGTGVPAAKAEPGFHVVVLQRGDGPQPGPEVIAAPGHVGFFEAYEGDRVVLIGGNQGNAVSRAAFPISRILGIREI